jgi:hypothetical protein
MNEPAVALVTAGSGQVNHRWRSTAKFRLKGNTSWTDNDSID